MKIKIALAQISKLGKIENTAKYIKKAKADLVIFPETSFTTDNFKFEKTLQALAKKYKARIIIGVVVKRNNQVFDFAYYISARQITKYQKIHVHRTEKFVPGDKFKVVETKLGKIGLLICYDVAFLEAGRVLALKGAELIVVISEIIHDFPFEHNLMRIQAIAHNNQIFAIDCCKAGQQFTGQSVIYNPKGRCLLKLSKYNKLKTKTIDTALIKKWRSQEKIYPDRLPKLYKEIIK